MKLQKQIKTAAALAFSALAVAGPAVAGTPLDSYRDGPERHSALTSAEAAAPDWFERAAARGQVSSAPLDNYRDAFERGAPVQVTSPITEISTADNSRFDWGAAAVGGSSALILALLIGGVLLTVRHFRGGPLPH